MVPGSLFRALMVVLCGGLGSLASASPALAGDQISVVPGFNGPVQAISNPDSFGTRYLGGEFTAFDSLGTGGGALVSRATGEVDRTFPKVSTGPGSGQVLASTTDINGGFYIGGDFNCLGPNLSGNCDGPEDFPRNNLAYINPDGTVSAWNPDPNGPVYALELSGTTLYLGGSFGEVAGQPRSNAAAVGVNGSLRDWNPNVVGGFVLSLVVAGERVYLGGGFSSVGGEARNFAAAVNLAGELVAGWNPIFGVGGGADGVFDIEVADGTVYLGGGFSTVDGQTRRSLAAVGTDGTLSGWSPNLNADFSGKATALEESGGIVYVGGTFSSIGGESRSNLGAVTTSGTVTGWNPVINGTVSDLKIDDTEVFISGGFTEVSGQPRNSAASVALSNGALLSWDPNPKGRLFTFPETLLVSGPDVYIGGYFDTVGGEQRNRLAAVDERGVLTTWNPGAIGPPGEGRKPVWDMTVVGNTVFLGGEFSWVAGQIRNGLAAVGTNGSLDPFNPSPDGPVYTIQADDFPGTDTIFFGGYFSCLGPNLSGNCDGAGDTARNNLAAVGTTGTPTPWNPNVNGTVLTLDISSSGTTFLGGNFALVGAETRNNAAAVGVDGALTSWNPDVNGTVESLELGGGRVYLGGTFSQVGGQLRSYAAAVGTDGSISSWNPSPNGSVRLLDVSGDVIFFAGGFYCLGPNPSGSCDGPGDTLRYGLAAAGNDGSISSWYPEPDSQVTALVSGGSTIYLGGYFDKLGTQSRNRSGAASVVGTVLGRWPSNGQTLTTALSGTGTGTITSLPAGINCGTSCSEVFGEVKPVALTATPAAGSRFAGWSGACTGTGACEVTMDEARSVTANFEQVFDLAVTRSGSGTGTITSSPAGIDCGAVCSESFLPGTIVTLTASAAAGSSFSGWSGACSGSTTCEVTMSEARSVDAEFSLIPPAKPKLANLKLKGPAKAKKGKKATYKVTVKNTGNASAKGLVVKAQGKGVKGSKKPGDLAAGKSKTISLPLKFNKKAKVTVTFTVTSTNAGKKTIEKTVKVK